MTKYAGRGFTVTLDAGPSAIPQLLSFGAFGSSRASIDATAYGDDWEDIVTGIQSGDEVPFKIAYDPANTQHQALFTLYESADTSCVLTVEHTASLFTAEINCQLLQLRREAPKDGIFSASGVFKIVNPGVDFIES